MKNLELLVKPVSHDCNLACDYCFYTKANSVYSGKQHVMLNKVLGKFVSACMEYSGQNRGQTKKITLKAVIRAEPRRLARPGRVPGLGETKEGQSQRSPNRQRKGNAVHRGQPMAGESGATGSQRPDRGDPDRRPNDFQHRGQRNH